ncbi:MAG: hypothetical protein C4555_06360 [Dehalococcoidia bacterium]|nr:MAG: hypothetical protein C4555_06360 [Dehalococcoidia bacterium]
MSEYWPFINTAITALIAVVVVPLMKHVSTIKNNHLAHIEKRLELIERKLDEHITFHLRGQ